MASPQGAVAAAVLLLAGCTEAVALGSLCPSLSADCAASGPHPGDPGAPLVTLDGSVVVPVVPVHALDSSLPSSPEAGVVIVVPPGPFDGGTRGILPALQNDSFELTRGSPGSLAYAPIDPVPLGVNLAEPWSACGFGVSVLESADSKFNSGLKDVQPTHGPGFVEANLGVPALRGIRQTLGDPMRGDVRYSFRIDVRAAVGANVGLEVWGSYVDCVGAMKLADVGPVPEFWSSVCVSFVPPTDVPELFLQPSLRSGDTNGDVRIFFDNIRSDPGCP